MNPAEAQSSPFRPVNLARILLSLLLGGVAAYAGLPSVIYFVVAHLIFSLLWHLAVQRGWIVEERSFWTGLAPLAVDLTFISVFVFLMGPPGHFAVLLYMVITALSSLSSAFRYGMLAAFLSPAAFFAASVSSSFWQPWRSFYAGPPLPLWLLSAVALLLLIACFLVAHTIRDLMMRNQQLLDEESQAHRQERERATQRYRLLVEGGADIIFALDEEFRFLSLNRAFTNTLGHRVADWIGKTLLDLVSPERGGVDRMLLEQTLQSMKRRPNPANFTIRLHTRLGEAAEMVMRLEPVDFEANHMIYGRASLHVDDMLIRYFHSERQRYILTNYLILADQISDRATRNAAAYMDADALTMLRLGLRELLINAIEHGNLEIDYAAKSKMMHDGQYMKFVAERQQEEAYRDRRVIVEHSINSRRIFFRITDQGAGFDHRAMQRRTEADMESGHLQHGRGLAIARAAFDRLRYNDRGNRVIATRRF
ncbi:MAG: ATP-binding protein [Leptospirales bacterium]|nr:ATP-binding protein [Leptospirales bacterium]